MLYDERNRMRSVPERRKGMPTKPKNIESRSEGRSEEWEELLLTS